MMQLEDVMVAPILPDSAFDAEQLAIGQQVELKRTEDLEVAKIVAKNNLLEDRDYYRKLPSGMHLDGNLPCPIYCAPDIQVLNGSLGATIWGYAAWPEKVAWVVSGLGAATAVGGLLAKKPVLTKVAGGIGVVGGISSLIFAIIRGNGARDMANDMQNAARTNAKDAVEMYGGSIESQAERSMIDVLVGGVAMTANAIALLLIPARAR